MVGRLSSFFGVFNKGRNSLGAWTASIWTKEGVDQKTIGREKKKPQPIFAHRGRLLYQASQSSTFQLPQEWSMIFMGRFPRQEVRPDEEHGDCPICSPVAKARLVKWLLPTPGEVNFSRFWDVSRSFLYTNELWSNASTFNKGATLWWTNILPWKDPPCY